LPSGGVGGPRADLGVRPTYGGARWTGLASGGVGGLRADLGVRPTYWGARWTGLALSGVWGPRADLGVRRPDGGVTRHNARGRCSDADRREPVAKAPGLDWGDPGGSTVLA
jgi:hypothetical protein